MRWPSLRLRLAAGGALAILAALLVAFLGLAVLFERQAARRLADELDVHLRQLAGGLAIAADGGVGVEHPPADPRFADPLSGLYWQVEPASGQVLRSRSLWDERLDLPADTPEDGSVDRHAVAGPGGQHLVVAERLLRGGADGAKLVRIAVAADLATVRAARDAFLADLAPGLGLLATVLTVAGWLQIGLGLRPLGRVVAGLSGIRAGRQARLDADGPDEVRPLIEEINALLALRDAELQRARHRAADLAHGLKTPLAALAGDAERLREKGETAFAADIEALGDVMRRHVDRELARARRRPPLPGHGAATPVAPLLEALVDTLRRTPDGRRVDFALTVPAATLSAVEHDDLMEIAGNLIENAAHHAAGTVRIRIEPRADGPPCLVVEDDGPGIAEADRAAVLERGRRLDESGVGSGLGLAIVGDLADAYGLDLTLDRSALGGLAVRIGVGRAG